MYLIFETLESAKAAQAKIDSNIVAALLEKEPEIVSDTGIIPRNAETGELNYEAARTTSWSEPTQHGENGVWYLISPQIDHPHFAGVDLLNGVEGYINSESLVQS